MVDYSVQAPCNLLMWAGTWGFTAQPSATRDTYIRRSGDGRHCPNAPSRRDARPSLLRSEYGGIASCGLPPRPRYRSG